jgi:hypothetical protein
MLLWVQVEKAGLKIGSRSFGKLLTMDELEVRRRSILQMARGTASSS